jgi:outer membrane protein insertion porin family
LPISSRLLMAAVVLQLALSESAYAEGETIAEISVRGNRRIEASVIQNAIKLKVGDTLYSDKTDADLRAIHKLGHFQEVLVSTEETTKGTVLIYTVQEKPVIRDIRFEGNKELSSEKLTKDGLDLRRDTIFSAKDLSRSVEKIRKIYQDEGYYLVEVTPRTRMRSPSEISVTFQIVENQKVLISSITFDGNRFFSNRKLRGFMETKQKWFLSWLTNAGTYRDEVLRNDALIIADQYQNNGYLNVKVGEPVVKLNEAKNSLEVIIGITEGEQYRIGDIEFAGDLLEPVSTMRAKLKSEPGAIFSRANIRADIITLTDLYGDKGYAFTNVTPLTKPLPESKSVNLTFDMEKGELVHIERIAISGNTKSRDKVVRRELRVTESGLFSATGMKRSKQNLMNTGYFEEANISTSKGSAGNLLNVSVDVKEKSTGSFSIGGGYSSLDGIIGQGSVSQTNFLGLGLKASFSASLGGSSSTFAIGLTDPYFRDTKWTLGADIYRSERDYLDYTRRVTGGDIKAGYPINDFVSTFFMYKYEIKKLFDPEDAYEEYNEIDPENFPLDTTSTSSIMASISHNNTDYRLDPSTGFVNNLSAEYAGLGGDNRFAKFTTDHTWFHPVYKKLIFSTKLSLGYIQEVGEDIPSTTSSTWGHLLAARLQIPHGLPHQNHNRRR